MGEARQRGPFCRSAVLPAIVKTKSRGPNQQVRATSLQSHDVELAVGAGLVPARFGIADFRAPTRGAPTIRISPRD
jgi:hypothetical protein